MTLPLRLIRTPTGDADLRQMRSAELEHFRYGLRRRYALSLTDATVSPGNILLGAGAGDEIVGSAINTRSNEGGFNTNPHAFPASGPGLGTPSTSTTHYHQNLAGIPAEITDLTNSYTVWISEGMLSPQTNTATVQALIIDPCIAEMRTGDQVGTYRVSVNAPEPTGWVDEGPFFTDTIFTGSTVTKLWLKTSSTALPAEFHALRGVTTGLQQINNNALDVVGDLMYNLLLQRVTTSLTYSMNSDATISRGSFVDTRLLGQGRRTQFVNANDYRTFSVPSGGQTTFNTYNFGLV